MGGRGRVEVGKEPEVGLSISYKIFKSLVSVTAYDRGDVTLVKSMKLRNH